MSACLVCKPARPRCRCACGYSCGGPGVCRDSMEVCLEKHFRRDCDHDFSGPCVRIDANCQSQVCQKCGVSAMDHDCAVGP